jgi:hypothetical protein
VAVAALTRHGMIAWANGTHWALLAPMPVFLVFRVTEWVPAVTGPAGTPAAEPNTTRVVPKPSAPTQSPAPATVSGVPLVVALPHWVTPTKTAASVAAVVVNVTVTD